MTDERNDRPLTTADMVQAGQQGTQSAPQQRMPAEDQAAALISGHEMEQFRARWTAIQAKFVDDPRSAVQEADSLVAELMKRIAETFAKERQGLESQWASGGDANPNTEDLRVALQRYRTFFNRLLSV